MADDLDKIDLNSFFSKRNESYEKLINTIKSIEPNSIIDENNNVIPTNVEFKVPNDENVFIEVDDNFELNELRRKYISYNNLTNNLTNNIVNVNDENTQNINNENIIIDKNKSSNMIINSSDNDPMINIFKNTKKTVDFCVDIKFEDKIPRIDFIEMMEESYNTSIIDFLAEQFSEKLLEDRENIKNIFKDSIHNMIAENNAKISNAKNDAKDSVKPKLNSKNKNAVKSKDLIDKISTMDNIDDINKAIQGIEIKSVLNYAKKRIKELNDR